MTEYTAIFNDAATVQAKTLIFTMVPVFALLVAMLHLRRGRYALEHLVSSLHAYTTFLILVVVTAYSLALPALLVGRLTHTSPMGNVFYDNLFGLVRGWYLRRALIRVYGDGPIFATVAAGGLFVGMGVILFAYRTLLFLTTFYST